MKSYSNEEIVAKCEEIWEQDKKIAYGSDPTVTVEHNSEDYIAIEFKAMYDCPNLNLRILMQLAEFFGTMNINDDDRFSVSGCETCDYGSSYGFTLTVRPE